MSRRTALFAMAGLAAAPFVSSQAQAASDPPRPENQLTPDAALDRLMRGNERYVNGETTTKDFASTRAALAQGQNPYACLLSCADSRVGPEFCFDESRGDLFVTRVAGNYVTMDILASLEYGVGVLKAPLIMVLGHTQCGAIGAAIDAYDNHTDYPGHIQSITTELAPAVAAVKGKKPEPSALMHDVTIQNIRMNMAKLASSTPMLRRAVEAGQLKVVGGLYQLKTGRVELIT
ncbi:carbonic anhydrase [Neopusillimonas aestuarii]|uniref:carbonic anhydrase n=1 Tax=Neopusillimonas aestuarii TaxID=2716226 RepID=UPI001D187114|nr:carbonic anhydrase [Pusillimonas sp. DMV24BSW_D]